MYGMEFVSISFFMETRYWTNFTAEGRGRIEKVEGGFFLSQPESYLSFSFPSLGNNRANICHCREKTVGKKRSPSLCQSGIFLNNVIVTFHWSLICAPPPNLPGWPA